MSKKGKSFKSGMFICAIELEFYLDRWSEWEAFRPDDPAPREILYHSVFVDLGALDYEPVKTFGFLSGGNLVGGGCVYAKETRGVTIGGIGKMAVDPLYRRNGIASHLIDTSLMYMFRHSFDISILWASVLKLYEGFGYIPLTRDGKETNMMYRPIKGLPMGWTKQRLLDLPSQVGTW